MSAATLRIALATVPFAPTLDDGVRTVARVLGDAAARGADLVCFPESYLPGLRGVGFPVGPHDQAAQRRALDAVREAARAHGVAAVVPMDWTLDDRLHNVAAVIAADGAMLGMQTKNQVAPEEDAIFAPGRTRRLFTVRGATLGIVICHEGWRYPETVRWAARRGAQVVLHPTFCGAVDGPPDAAPRRFLDVDASYHERTLVARAGENTVWFASVNYALPRQDAATAVIDPDGRCLAHAPYGVESLLVADLDLTRATGALARRYAPERYAEEASPGAGVR